MAKVFISYARADEAMAERVATALADAGHVPWWDRDLPAHRSFSQVIEEQLDDCDAALILWSEHSAASEWVRAEADHSRTAHKLVQASLDDAIPPLPFNQFHSESLQGFTGDPDHHGWQKLLASIAAVAKGEGGIKRAVRTAAKGPRSKYAGLIAAAVIALAALAAVFLLRTDRGDDGTTTLAVLPFEAATDGDAALAAGLWEDTRSAISRSGQIAVIGRETVRGLSQQDLLPAEYRKRLDVDYVLSGTVRRNDAMVRMTVSLVDTRDGTEKWGEQFDRPLDDVLKLQYDLANEVEGRIRGRLVVQDENLPENLATSSEAYLLYSEAQALMATRGIPERIEAHRLIKQALELDPNYAPAWASLSIIEWFLSRLQGQGGVVIGDPEAHARRAIDLAPNLSAGHAALGLALDYGKPLALVSLERAVQLDPNNVDALNWYAGALMQAGNEDKAREVTARAVRLNPLYLPAVANHADNLLDNDRMDEFERLQQQIEKTGDKGISALLAQNKALHEGDLSTAAKIGIDAAKRDDAVPLFLAIQTDQALATLDRTHAMPGYDELEPVVRLILEEEDGALDVFWPLFSDAKQFWSNLYFAPAVSRLAVTRGHGATLIARFDALDISADEFVQSAGVEFSLPNLVVALRQSGRDADASRLLQAAAARLQQTTNPEVAFNAARIRALQGRDKEALALLQRSLEAGYVPLGPWFDNDLAEEPAFASLVELPRFVRLRRALLALYERERREFDALKLN